MYIEELMIDNYLQQLNEYESQEEQEGPPPVMSEIVEMYSERGELFLDDDSVQEEIAPDIMGMMF